MASTLTERDVPSPTSLAFSALSGGQVEFFAATAGREAAVPLEFNLEDIAAPAPAASNTLAQLVPLSESSLALVGSLLTMSVQTLDGESDSAPGESEANAAVAFLSSPGPSVAQSLSRQGGSASTGSDDDGEGEAIEIDDEPGAEAAQPPSRAGSAWKRYLLGIDQADQKPAPRGSCSSSARGRRGPSTSVVPPRRWPRLGCNALRSRRPGPPRARGGPRGAGGGREERVEWSLSAAVVWVVAGRLVSSARWVKPPGPRPSAPVRGPHRLPRPGVVGLTSETALVGHNGRGDVCLDSPPD